MTTIFYDDLDKVCRGCLCKNGEMRPLFGSFLDKMLRTVAEIEVHAGDGLPELMCVPCVLQVSRAFTFKQLCQRSDQTLRTFYREMEKCMSDTQQESNAVKETKAILMNDTSENNVSSMTIIPKSLDQSSALQQAPSSTLPNLTTNSDLNNQSFDVQYQSSNSIDSINKCMLLENDESSDIANSAINSQVNVTDNDIANLIATATTNTCNADPTLMNLKVEGNNFKDIISFPVQNNLIQTTESIVNDIKVDVLSVLESNVMETDLIDDNFGSYSDNETTESQEVDNKDDLILDIFTTAATNPDLDNLESALEPVSHSQPEQTTLSLPIATVTNPTPKKQKSFECPECHKIFGENKVLKRHLKIHNPVKPHVCSVCEMTFAESSNLTKHMKKHTGELRNIVGKPNLCSVCGKGFKWASSLSKHMKHHTRHKILNCPYCTKYYVEARSLNIHLRSHTGEKPFICDICNKAFTQTGNLEKHMRVHTGEKPYICPVCNKRFSQSGYVAIHLRTHTGEKPYVCTECGKAFAGSSTLSIHKRTHTGERPYPCSMCDKTFARQETAIIHQRTHTGEKPHICKICHRGFSSTGHLNGHMRSHSGLKTHECNVCQKKFAGSSSLKVHMKTHTIKNPTDQYEIQTQLIDVESTIEDDKIFLECNVCGQNIPSSALNSIEALQSYEHEVMDGVLICSNVNSIIEQVSDAKVIEELQDENGTNFIITTVNAIEHIHENQTLVINPQV